MEDCEFCVATLDDAEQIFELETDSYPEDEAATFDKIKYRIENACELFYVMKKQGSLIGFVNGTCVSHDTIHHDSMSCHQPTGRNLVIHSVTVSKDLRRQKVASNLMRQYLKKISELKRVDKVLLLCKNYLLPFYLQNGFHYDRVSSVVHGQEQWNEMSLNLKDYFGVSQWVVDAFAARPFSGNPAAVVLQHGTEEWMQNVALENNYAETSFLEHIKDSTYKLRW
jgi:predicted GNAT family N-acyltransferase